MENVIRISFNDLYSEKNLEGIVIYITFFVNFFDGSGIEYRSNRLTELKGIMDESGTVEINIDELIKNSEYQKYHRLWWEKIYIEDGIWSPETDFLIWAKFYNSSTDVYATRVWEEKLNYNQLGQESGGGPGYNKEGNTGLMTIGGYELNSIRNELNITKLKENFKAAELKYLFAKEEYVNNLKNVSIDTSSVFERVADYEPRSWVYVITRLLELNEGTIEPALRFTKNAEMSVENKRLTMIQKTIENLLNLYPDITINDGEGIPYNK